MLVCALRIPIFEFLRRSLSTYRTFCNGQTPINDVLVFVPVVCSSPLIWYSERFNCGRAPPWRDGTRAVSCTENSADSTRRPARRFLSGPPTVRSNLRRTPNAGHCNNSRTISFLSWILKPRATADQTRLNLRSVVVCARTLITKYCVWLHAIWTVKNIKNKNLVIIYLTADDHDTIKYQWALCDRHLWPLGFVMYKMCKNHKLRSFTPIGEFCFYLDIPTYTYILSKFVLIFYHFWSGVEKTLKLFCLEFYLYNF